MQQLDCRSVVMQLSSRRLLNSIQVIWANTNFEEFIVQPYTDFTPAFACLPRKTYPSGKDEVNIVEGGSLCIL